MIPSGIIPVSTLPPALPRPLEALPSTATDPGRLIPVPMPEPTPDSPR
jgi:hypothetical protein